jgi:hypothetical protein
MTIATADLASLIDEVLAEAGPEGLDEDELKARVLDLLADRALARLERAGMVEKAGRGVNGETLWKRTTEN